MDDTSIHELYESFGTARRVLDWTAMVEREEPDALGGMSVELADQRAGDVVHLTGGCAGEGHSIRVEV